MLIKTKYIDCASKSVFNTWKLPTSAADTSGDIYWSAIVCIQDTGEVWTHGKLYGGFFSNADSNKVSLTIGGATKILALDGHVQPYTTLTGSGTTADQAILSTGVANKWTLKTLGKNAFSNVDYLPADATAVAAEKVVNAMRFQYNGKDMHSFDGSVARLLNIIQGDNVFITGDSQGNVTIAADPGSDTVNTAGATNLINKKLFLIGAESQTTSPQTYSNQYVYIGTDNCLYSLGKKVLTEHQAIYNLDLQTQVGDAVTKVTTFDPNAANNSFTLVQGTNVTLLPDATNKKVTISSKDTTYDFYNLAFKQGDAVIDTYKPTTAPNKAFRAGTNVTFTKSGDEVIVTTQDTRNTAGATEKLATKLFLTGSLTQTDNPQTYTNSKVYIGTDNKLYSDGKVVSTGDHTHNYVKDIGNDRNTTFAYSKVEMNYGDFTWLAGWDGYELRAVNKSLFAQASHTHDYIPRVRILNPSDSSTQVGVVPFNVLGLKTGYPLSTDPEFASGNGIVSLYNNAGNGVTVIERISDSSAANTTGYVIRIKNTGAASHGLGGFHNSVTSRANAIFAQIFRAKIPTGYSVVTASNSMGTSYGDVWITDTAGTGKWEWYGRIMYCGESGSFSTGSYVYLNGNTGTPSSPLYWYISYCQVYDLTKGRYDGLRCRYADEVTNADTVDGQHASAFSYKSWWHWSGQGGQPTWLWGGDSENNYYVYNPSNFDVNSATYAHKVRGEYTSNGGQQNPDYFGVNWVGFRMMNTTIGTNSQYKDWIISDCYAGNDVGGAVAFGMNRQSLGAYLMGSDAARTSWTRKGTFWGDWNLDPVDKTFLHKSRVPGEMVDFYVYKVGSYTCTSTSYTTFRNQLFDSSGRGKSSVTYQPTYASSKTYTVNLSDFILAYNGIPAYNNGMYTAGGGETESNRIGLTAGANSKTISGLEMPKHAHWFGRYRSDNANDRDVFGPDGNQNWSTNGTSTAGQGGNWRTGYSGSGSAKDWRPKTIFVFKMIYAPQSW